MNKLTSIIINYDGESLDGENIDGIGNMISYFGELSLIELNLKDNYIDNLTFEELLENWDGNSEI